MTKLSNKCRVSGLLLLVCAFLLQPTAVAVAGGGDPPNPPNANTTVVHARTETESEVASAGSASRATRGEQLATGTVSSDIEIAGDSKSLTDWLEVYQPADPATGQQDQATVLRNEQIHKAIIAALEVDLAAAEKDLDIDKVTRAETKKLDEKYGRVQAVVHNRRRGRNNVASLRSAGDVQTFFQQVLGVGDDEPRRVQFVAPANFLAGHFIAGDLYIDPNLKIASLVTWDSIDQTALSIPDMLDQELPDGYTRVSHEILTEIQTLPSGCSQCALQFTDDMAEMDLHSEQLSRLIGDRGSEFKNEKIIESRDVLSISRTTGNASSIATRTLRLVNSRGALRKSLRTAYFADLRALRNNEITETEFAERHAERRAAAVEAKSNRQERNLTETATTETNLLIDKKRTEDLREVLATLEGDGGHGLLSESKSLYRTVAERADEAGRDQAVKIQGIAPDLRRRAATGRKDDTARRVTSQAGSSASDQVAAREADRTLDVADNAWDLPTPPGAEQIVRTDDNDEEVGDNFGGGYKELALDDNVDVSEIEEDSRPFSELAKDEEFQRRDDF